MRRPTPRTLRPAAEGFTLAEVIVSATLGAIVAAGMAGSMLAMARSQARLIRLQNAADALALARVQVQASPTAPTVSGAAITSPTITPIDGCPVVVTDATGAPYQLALAATCGDAPQAVTLEGWATWSSPAAPPVPPAPPTP